MFRSKHAASSTRQEQEAAEAEERQQFQLLHVELLMIHACTTGRHSRADLIASLFSVGWRDRNQRIREVQSNTLGKVNHLACVAMQTCS